jgi:hypothetical protein
MHRLVKLGQRYEVFIDIITSTQDDAVTIDVDEKRRLLVVLQGPDMTSFDDQLVEFQRMPTPTRVRIHLCKTVINSNAGGALATLDAWPSGYPPLPKFRAARKFAWRTVPSCLRVPPSWNFLTCLTIKLRSEFWKT